MRPIPKTLLCLALLLSGGSLAAAEYRIDSWADGLDQPWSIAFLPGGAALVSELGGRLRPVSAEGEVGAPLKNVPAVYFAGQGGLFDVVLHPDFKNNGLVYLSFAEGSPGDNGTAVARGRLSGDFTGRR